MEFFAGKFFVEKKMVKTEIKIIFVMHYIHRDLSTYLEIWSDRHPSNGWLCKNNGTGYQHCKWVNNE